MKTLTLLISLSVLSSCASVMRYQVGKIVTVHDCSSTIEGILNAYNYRVTGCGYTKEVNYSEISEVK